MNESDQRPNPDLILQSLQRTSSTAGKGKLRIFFGMCPGVGKTFAMLKAAHEQKSKGLDVKVGVVETHGRPETEALCVGLDRVPLKQIRYRETDLHEMDLDAILACRPNIILVDELAHTNAPTSRHPKRYQDVIELLDAGIDVYTTLNVQHIASRAEIVTQITQTQIRETVPDSIFEYAEQIELIDLTPDQLLLRLKEGKVYQGDRVARAQDHFFKAEYLIALRELALRFTAEMVDFELQSRRNLNQIKGAWKTVERYLVAVSFSPFSESLLRHTRRMAFQVSAPWIALYVDTGKKLNPTQVETLQKNLKLARELGAEVVTTRDDDIPTAIKRTAIEKNVTQIVMGRPIKRFWSDRIQGGSLLDQLVNEVSDIDVHVVRQSREARALVKKSWRLKLQFQSTLAHYWSITWFLILVTVINLLLESFIGYRAVGFVYLLGVIVGSMLIPRGPILFNGFVSAMLWNFFFIPPKFTFVIGSPEDIMMFLMFFVVAVVMGGSAARLRRKDKVLLQREKRAQILYRLSQSLSDATQAPAIAETAIRSLTEVFPGQSAVLIGEGLTLSPQIYNPLQLSIEEKDLSLATWSYRNHAIAGMGTNTLNSARALSIPLKGHDKTVGVLLYFPKPENAFFSVEQQNLLDTICNHLAISLERALIEGALQKSKVFEESDKLYRTLLDSVSHELRTPLTSIIGNASALQSAAPSLIPTLASDLISAARRLNRVIENLLDMSRLSTTSFKLNQEILLIEDVLRQALRACEPELRHRQVEFQSDHESHPVRGDDRLLEHVFVNLILNATQYSPPGTSIDLSVRVLTPTRLQVVVSDRGPGVNPSSIPHLFEKFYRVPGSAPGGTGLGLSIVKGLVEAHGGRVTMDNRLSVDGSIAGADFKVELPSEIIPEALR